MRMWARPGRLPKLVRHLPPILPESASLRLSPNGIRVTIEWTRGVIVDWRVLRLEPPELGICDKPKLCFCQLRLVHGVIAKAWDLNGQRPRIAGRGPRGR